MKVKEKIIGGILNANQFGWLIGGLLLGILAFVGLFSITGPTFAVVIGIIIMPCGIPFAFYKKNELTLYQYLTYKKKFKKKVQKLPNKRKGVI